MLEIHRTDSLEEKKNLLSWGRCNIITPQAIVPVIYMAQARPGLLFFLFRKNRANLKNGGKNMKKKLALALALAMTMSMALTLTLIHI